MLHFSKLKTQEDFFFCLSASLQLLLCTTISEWDRNATGRLFIAWPQKPLWILQVHCRYHSQTTQSIRAYNLLNNYFSTPREPTTNTKGIFISRHTSITEHTKTDSSTWIIPEGIKTFSKQHLTSQLKYFRFLFLISCSQNFSTWSYTLVSPTNTVPMANCSKKIFTYLVLVHWSGDPTASELLLISSASSQLLRHFLVFQPLHYWMLGGGSPETRSRKMREAPEVCRGREGADPAGIKAPGVRGPQFAQPRRRKLTCSVQRG